MSGESRRYGSHSSFQLEFGIGAPNQDFGSQRAGGSNRGVQRHILDPWLPSTVDLRKELCSARNLIRQFRDPVSTDGSTLVPCFNKEFFHYTTAFAPTPSYRQTARLHTPIIITLSECNSTFDLCCYSSYLRIQFLIIYRSVVVYSVGAACCSAIQTCCSVAVDSVAVDSVAVDFVVVASCSAAVDFVVVASCSAAVDFGVVASGSAAVDFGVVASCSVAVDFGVVASCSEVVGSAAAASCSEAVGSAAAASCSAAADSATAASGSVVVDSAVAN